MQQTLNSIQWFTRNEVAFMVLTVFATHGVSMMTEHLAISEFPRDSGTWMRHVQHNSLSSSSHGSTERLRLEGTPGSALVQPPHSRRGILSQVPRSISRWFLSISRSLQICIQEVRAQTVQRFSILFLYCYLQFDHDNKAALMETIKDRQFDLSSIQKLHNLKELLTGFDSR